MKTIDYNLHGWLAVNKPEGPTSFDVIRQLRRFFPKIKCGHGGTLDPLACGVLPLALGEATKVIPWIIDQSKSYRFVIKWGEQRTTDDRQGDIQDKSNHRPTKRDIESILPQFTGSFEQMPPAYSAIKINGKRACDRLRNHEDVKLTSRTITIHNLELHRYLDDDHAEFIVNCAKGTYVRSLARDMARALGTLGYAFEIERIHVGPFTLNKTISLEALAIEGEKRVLESYLQPLDTVLDDILAVTSDAMICDQLRQGQSILLKHFNNCHARLVDFDFVLVKGKMNNPIAMTVYRDGYLWPKTVFNIQS